jgi:hypothetical protein
LKQKVDDVASDIERFVLKVVASACLEIRVRRVASRETITLTSSHIAQELAFSPWLSVSYPDELGPWLDADGRASANHESYCNQIGDLHLDVLDSLFEMAAKTPHDGVQPRRGDLIWNLAPILLRNRSAYQIVQPASLAPFASLRESYKSS